MSQKQIKVDKKKKQQPLRLGVDTILFWVVIALLVFGLLMLYSASWQYSVTIMGKEPSYLLKRQLRFLMLGATAAIIAFFVDYKKLGGWVKLGMVGMIFLLGLVIFLDEIRLGSRRGLFSGSIQPSEFAKLMVIVYLAYWLHQHKEHLHKFFYGIVPVALILGISSALIIIQPDLSAAITIFIIGGLLYFFAGGKFSHISIALVGAVFIVIIAMVVFETGKTRVEDYITGLQDPANASYHLKRSFEAIVNGGIFGVGIGRGNTKFTGLPVAPTDSIFSVIVEETGVLGASFIIMLFILFLWRGFYIAKHAPDTFGRLLAAGITTWIITEAFVNMSVLVNLLPFAGNALPFISYGGSNLTMVLTGVGIIMSVARQTAIKNNKKEGRPLNAVVNLRRNDGRRRVSSARRSSSVRK